MIRNKKVANHASMDVIELTNHLRQEHLLVSYEKQHIQKLNEKVRRTFIFNFNYKLII